MSSARSSESPSMPALEAEAPHVSTTVSPSTNIPRGSQPTSTTATTGVDVDDEIEQMKKRIAELEEEEKRVSQLASALNSSDSQVQQQQQSQSYQPSVSTSSQSTPTPAQSSSTPLPSSNPEVDARSVYVGNVDYSCTTAELQQLFAACGTVNRVTILVDKFTGHPKGFAYVEFKEAGESIANALLLNDTEFKGRQLKVTEKRTNIAAFARGRGQRGRGRGGFASRGRGQGARFANRKQIYAPY